MEFNVDEDFANLLREGFEKSMSDIQFWIG